jgi:uroporphyrinogen-III synthase
MAGFKTALCPLFSVRPIQWTAPDPDLFDAIMLTSANALLHGGDQLAQYTAMRAFAVGHTTASAARKAGFSNVFHGSADVQSLMAAIAGEGYRHVLHLAGQHVRPVDPGEVRLTQVVVYASDENATDLQSHIFPGDVLLVHSARAGRRLAALIPPEQRATLNLVAISPAALAAADDGWACAVAANSPDDGAMLAIAKQICQ